ncbi:MAG: hypothetical protein ABDH19_01355 [Thermodesulfovibrio sp.]
MNFKVLKEAKYRKIKRRKLLRKNILEKVNNGLYCLSLITKPYKFFEFSDVDIAFVGIDEEKIFFETGFLR